MHTKKICQQFLLNFIWNFFNLIFWKLNFLEFYNKLFENLDNNGNFQHNVAKSNYLLFHLILINTIIVIVIQKRQTGALKLPSIAYVRYFLSPVLFIFSLIDWFFPAYIHAQISQRSRKHQNQSYDCVPSQQWILYH